MNHRERVLTALNREEPDRCPMQISFTPEFAARLQKDIEQGEAEGRSIHPHGGDTTYLLERALGQDMLLTGVGWANSYYQDADNYTDDWGIGWRSVYYDTKFGQGRYTEICSHPLAEDEAVDSYQGPDPEDPTLYEEAARVISNYRDEYFVVGVTVTTIFETAWALRGLDKLLIDLVIKPELANQILDIPYKFHLAAAKKLVEMGVDMIWTGDDVGTQKAMMISPDTWRKYFKPRMATFISELKKINPDVKVAYHSDGTIIPIIPDLIEIGLDVLNPVQPAAMDPEKIKKDYGDKLSFWGTVDEQYTLPFGSPEDVEQEIITRLKTTGSGGGLVIGPTHHVQLDTPVENFWAMVNTIKNTSYASLK